jgi:hypothetical protein
MDHASTEQKVVVSLCVFVRRSAPYIALAGPLDFPRRHVCIYWTGRRKRGICEVATLLLVYFQVENKQRLLGLIAGAPICHCSFTDGRYWSGGVGVCVQSMRHRSLSWSDHRGNRKQLVASGFWSDCAEATRFYLHRWPDIQSCSE